MDELSKIKSIEDDAEDPMMKTLIIQYLIVAAVTTIIFVLSSDLPKLIELRSHADITLGNFKAVDDQILNRFLWIIGVCWILLPAAVNSASAPSKIEPALDAAQLAAQYFYAVNRAAGRLRANTYSYPVDYNFRKDSITLIEDKFAKSPEKLKLARTAMRESIVSPGNIIPKLLEEHSVLMFGKYQHSLPQISNVFDSLAENFMAHGLTHLALEVSTQSQSVLNKLSNRTSLSEQQENALRFNHWTIYGRLCR